MIKKLFFKLWEYLNININIILDHVTELGNPTKVTSEVPGCR